MMGGMANMDQIPVGGTSYCNMDALIALNF